MVQWKWHWITSVQVVVVALFVVEVGMVEDNLLVVSVEDDNPAYSH